MSLAGKDFFTEDEAAHYSCVSKSQFRRLKVQYGILHFSFMGKNLYRREDLRQILDRIAQEQRSVI